MSVSACMYVCMCTSMQCLQVPEEGSRCPGTGIAGGCEPPRVSWEQSLRPLEEEQVLLIAELQLSARFFLRRQKERKKERKEGRKEGRKKERKESRRQAKKNYNHWK